MLRILVVTLALGCAGGKATVKHEPTGGGDSDPVTRPRAEKPWVAAGGCIQKKSEDAACVTVTIADAAKIREIVIEHLKGIKDLPDLGLAMRLAEAPIAQWTTLGYRFFAEQASVVFEASEESGGMRSGFRVVLVNESDWKLTDLKMFSEGQLK